MEIAQINKLGFGTSQIGGPTLIDGQWTGAKPVAQDDAVRILRYAFDQGVNFFDTSDKYGLAEDFIGVAFATDRHKICLATKCGITDLGKRDFSISYVRGCLEKSLKRMRTDYIDIFQLAKPQVEDVNDSILSFAEQMKKEGKIRHFGISIIDEDSYYLEDQHITSLQIFYNLLFVGCHEFLKKSREQGKMVIIRSPLNSGILSGRYTLETKFQPMDARSQFFKGELFRERLENLEKIKTHFGLTAQEVLPFSLNFILSNPAINSVIPAASRIEQLQQYLEIFRGMNRMSPAEVEQVVYYIQNEIYFQAKSQK
ncbi:MAG: aldo/keto reductase [Candidatus Omnitrophica bacterium]|nr:aldo/keto reductase [Candidatus Omnitrophota bacterium]